MSVEKEKTLTNKINYPKCEGTITNSGLSAPVSSGFFMPHIQDKINSLLWRVKRAEHNTRKGNKPRCLLAVVETRHSFLAKQPTQQEAAS